jgi:hypothetical protein
MDLPAAGADADTGNGSTCNGVSVVLRIVIACSLLALSGCAPSYRAVDGTPREDAYRKAEAACAGDAARMSALAAAARQELQDDCMAAQGFARVN